MGFYIVHIAPYLRVKGYILSTQDEAAGLGEGQGGGAPLQHLTQPRLHLLHLQLKLGLTRPKQEKLWFDPLSPDILLLIWGSVSCAQIYRPNFRENKPKTLVFND
jgi:hypothetical protein